MTPFSYRSAKTEVRKSTVGGIGFSERRCQNKSPKAQIIGGKPHPSQRVEDNASHLGYFAR
jgi:hypothetical protein